jgi:hypothetical protein
MPKPPLKLLTKMTKSRTPNSLTKFRSAKIYTKTMSSIIAQGTQFVAGEMKRLDRMMDGSVAPKKLDEFTVRKNILGSFQ